MKLYRLTIRFSFLIAILLIASGTLSYYLSTSEIRENTFNNNIEVLGQAELMVATALGVIVRNAYSAAIHESVVSGINKDWDEYPADTEDISRLLNTQAMSSYYIHSMCVYSRYNDSIITDSGVIPLSIFPDREAVEEFYISDEVSSWKRTEGNYSSFHGAKPVIGFMIRIPIELKEGPGVMVVNVDEGLLFQTVLAVNRRYLGDIYIIDANGFIISHSDKSLISTRYSGNELTSYEEQSTGFLIDSTGEDSQFISYLTSPYTGWRYIATKDYKTVVSQNRRLLLINIFIALFFVILGSVISMLLSRRYYEPIGEIVRQIDVIIPDGEGERSSSNDFQYIHNSIRKFSSDMVQSKALLKEHFLIDLLIGKHYKEDVLQRQLDYYDIGISVQNFIVAILRLDDEDDLSFDDEQKHLYSLEAETYEIINRHCQGVVINRGWHELVLVMNFTRGKTAAEKIADQVTSELTNRIVEFNESVSLIGIGGFYDSIYHISHSYKEANEALRYEGLSGSGSIIRIEDIRNQDFPHEQLALIDSQKMQLHFYLKAGRYDEAVGMVKPLVGQILDSDKLNRLYKNMTLYSIAGDIIREIIRVHEKSDEILGSNLDPLLELQKCRTKEEFTDWFRELLRKIETSIPLQNKTGIKDIVKSIEKYMIENYAEITDLTQIADLSSFNINYLGRVFKEDTGKTLFEYLTELRLQSACKLLAETDMSITGIAADAGFSNERNIARAFKRFYKMSPTEYRKRNVIHRLETVYSQG